MLFIFILSFLFFLPIFFSLLVKHHQELLWCCFQQSHSPSDGLSVPAGLLSNFPNRFLHKSPNPGSNSSFDRSIYLYLLLSKLEFEPGFGDLCKNLFGKLLSKPAGTVSPSDGEWDCWKQHQRSPWWCWISKEKIKGKQKNTKIKSIITLTGQETTVWSFLCKLKINWWTQTITLIFNYFYALYFFDFLTCFLSLPLFKTTFIFAKFWISLI